MFKFSESIFFWTCINFFLLLFFVHKFILPVFYRLLEEREKKRLNLLDELEHNKKDAENLKKLYEEHLNNIKNEAQQIIKNAEIQNNKIRSETIDQAFAEKQKILENIKDELIIEKKRFIGEMQESAIDLIIHCTRKILKKEIAEQDHEKIIKENIQDLEKIIKV